MGGGASSADSKGQRNAPSGGTFAITPMRVLSAAQRSNDADRIKDLETQIRDLKARPAPASAPGPPHFSPGDTASFPYELPPLDESRMTPALASTAAALREKFASASSNAQALMRTMHEIRMEWNLLPVAPAGIRAVRGLPTAALLSQRNTDPPPPVAAFDSHSNGINYTSNAARSTVDYATSMALSVHRRELAHMEAVFKQYKDVDGGLSKAALIAALQKVGAPVLSSSNGTFEDNLFRRADTNLSGAVDQNEYFFSSRLFPPSHHTCVTRRFMLVANLPDDLEMFLADHNLSVSAAAALPSQLTCRSLCGAVCCTGAPRPCAQRKRPAGWPDAADRRAAGCRVRRKHYSSEGAAAQGAEAAATNQPGARSAAEATEQHQVPNQEDGGGLDWRLPQRADRSHR
jgi:hypothetical protein